MPTQLSTIKELESIATHLNGADRIQALRQLLDRPIENPAGWYLLGKEMLQANDLNAAARAFGMAYHQNVDITSAAVLTFACLKAARSEQPKLKAQFIQTWEEMKSPPLGVNTSERQVLQLMAVNKTAPVANGGTAESFFNQFLQSPDQ